MKLLSLLLLCGMCAATVHPVDGKTKGAFDNSCLAQARKVAAIISALPHPPSWNYYVYCNRNVWENALRSADNHGTDWAFTSLNDHTTHVNGTMFERQSELPIGVTAEFIVAHELGHIATGSDSEDVANQWAKEQLTKAPQKAAYRH